jgi:hypothetical protein
MTNYPEQSGAYTYKVYENDQLPGLREEFNRALRTAPEFNADIDNLYTLGGFGALGGFPTAWHAQIFRKIRADVTRAFAPVASAYIINENIGGIEYNLETIPDRPGIRYISQKADRETWHRDVTPRDKLCNENDVIFGGWVNLGVESQYFSFIPGSHRDNSLYEFSANPGFATVKDKDQLKQLDSKKFIIEIKPGEAVAFPQHILHEVLSIKATSVNYRQFVGFRLTESMQPLNNLDIENQGVHPLPSGQIPRNYSKNHGSCFLEKRFTLIPDQKDFKLNVQEWSQRTFKPELIQTYTRNSGARKGETYKVVPSTLASLKELGLPLYPEYSQIELDLIRPTPFNYETIDMEI